METAFLIIITLSAFIATNLDDIFILMAFFASSDFKKEEVVLGQYLGMIMLILISSLAYLFQLIIPSYWIGLLGIFPIIIGVRNLLNIRKDPAQQIPKKVENNSFSGKTGLKSFQIAGVTFANGGDNLGVYAPLFAGLDLQELLQVILIFLVMTGLWCFLSFKIVNNRIIGTKIRIYGHLILPFVLIAIGFYIILQGFF
ncbi:MAG TPA: cadmium resistance transporter [Methanobacterium sp.]